MQFTELNELNHFVKYTKKLADKNSFNNKQKLPEQLENLNTCKLLDIQLKMIQDDFNFESDEEQQHSEFNQKENSPKEGLINKMLDDFCKEETLKSKNKDLFNKTSKILNKIDFLLKQTNSDSNNIEKVDDYSQNSTKQSLASQNLPFQANSLLPKVNLVNKQNSVCK